MAQVSFEPGSLDGFAEFLDGLISMLDFRHERFQWLASGDASPDLPRPAGDGTDVDEAPLLAATEAFLSAHEQQAGQAEQAVRQLGRQLEVLAAAARDIADTYRTAEDVAEAISRHTERLLDQGTPAPTI